MGYFFCAVLLRAVQESPSFHLHLPRASGLRNLLENIQKFTWTSATTSCSSASAKDLMSLLLITLLKSEREQQHEHGQVLRAAHSAGKLPDLIPHTSRLPQSSSDLTPAIITRAFQAGRELTQPLRALHQLSAAGASTPCVTTAPNGDAAG